MFGLSREIVFTCVKIVCSCLWYGLLRIVFVLCCYVLFIFLIQNGYCCLSYNLINHFYYKLKYERNFDSAR